MGIIYEPSGRAREYSPLAANIYSGCDHGCKYCYAPMIKYMTREQYITETIPRKNIIKEMEKDVKKHEYSRNQVLLCFMGDPYCKANDKYKTTRDFLFLMLDAHIPVAILTKGGTRALQDMDIIAKYKEHIKIGSTLTFYDESLSREWEPGSASPVNRFEMLKAFHGKGIKTWASFEPVIDPTESLKLIESSLDFVDEYKIGKINNFNGLDKTIDWTSFLESVVEILRNARKPFYIKQDLRDNAPSIKLYGNEVLPDEHNVQPWQINSLF